MSDSDDSAEQISALVERAESALDRLGEEDDPDSALEGLEDLYAVADEAADLLETVDLSELPDAVDGDDLLEAIETGDIPKAIEEGDAGEAVDYKALVKAINFRNLASSANITDLVSEGRDLQSAVDDLGDDGDEGDDGILGTGIGAEEGDDPDDADDADDDGFVDGFDDALGGDDGLGGGMGNLGNLPDEAYQVTIQEKAMEAVDEFREGVLEAHDKLQVLYDKNREQMRRQHDEQGTNSRNPTAHSTVPTERGDVGGSATQHSTIPKGTKYSTAPTRTRIYGNRFDKRRRQKSEKESRKEPGKGSKKNSEKESRKK